MSTQWRRALALLITIYMVGAIGCGEGEVQTYPVQGTLRYLGTEETIIGAGVELRPVDPIDKQHSIITVGIVKDDGTIEFTTFKPGDGATEGKHQVLLSEPPTPRDWDFDARRRPPPAVIPKKYKSYSTSELSIDVTKGDNNQLDIQIERPQSE